MKNLLSIFIILFFVGCSPKLFTTYKENGKKQEKINLAKLNEYISKKRFPGFEKSSPWSNVDNSTGSYIFTSKNDKTIISIVKKDGEFTFLKKIVKLENKIIVNEYLSNGILEKSDTILKTEINKRPQIDITIKNPAPNFTFKNIIGNETSLSDLSGKYVYIYVWATWNTPSQSEIMELNKIISEYKGKNIVFIAIALDSKIAYQEWQQIVNDKDLKGIQLFCGEGWESNFADDYKVYYVPRAILINPKGKVIDAFAPRPSNITLESTLDSIFLSGKEFSQNLKKPNIVIDTVEVNFKLKDIADITSFVPQIKSGVNSVVQRKINEDLRTYFQASSIRQDSVAYVKKLLEEFEVENLGEYFEEIESIKEWRGEFTIGNPYYFGDELEEGFKIEYLSENLLNITIDNQILPYGGQYQFFFESIRYDLRTGNKLDFNDFFSISKEVLNQNLQENGYWLEWNNETQKIYKKPFGLYHEEYRIDDLVFGENACNDFYFSTFEDEIYLIIKLKCVGKYLMDYGIPLEKLKPHIEYFEFKNLLQLWGENANSLIGQDYAKLGSEIVFEDYSIKDIGGYLLLKDNFDADFGIAEYRSSENLFLLFFKSTDSKKIITDVLKIDLNDLKDRKIPEYCITGNGLDTEIIAIVKDSKSEFYTEIIKAWRANRTTGKFEIISKRKIKRCLNESYGI